METRVSSFGPRGTVSRLAVFMPMNRSIFEHISAYDLSVLLMKLCEKQMVR
jgi:hypothetical protein